LVQTGDEVCLTVTDDGLGFDTDAESSGFGNRSMKERAAAIGGHLSVASETGAGTRVYASISVVGSVGTEDDGS